MTTIPPHIHMFPSADSVFADRVKEHSELLFPLFSVELSHINPQWTGKVHMLEFNEDPYNQKTVASFTDYCKDCMIAFDIKGGKYSFKTDFSYFDLTPDWQEWFEKTKNTFEQTRQRFIDKGELITPANRPGRAFEQLGGECNWIQSDETPLDPDGERMTFVAQAYSGNYTDDYCEKYLYLFYSDKHKLAVILYQTT